MNSIANETLLQEPASGNGGHREQALRDDGAPAVRGIVVMPEAVRGSLIIPLSFVVLGILLVVFAGPVFALLVVVCANALFAVASTVSSWLYRMQPAPETI